jgi:hypothetical protein
MASDRPGRAQNYLKIEDSEHTLSNNRFGQGKLSVRVNLWKEVDEQLGALSRSRSQDLSSARSNTHFNDLKIIRVEPSS